MQISFISSIKPVKIRIYFTGTGGAQLDCYGILLSEKGVKSSFSYCLNFRFRLKCCNPISPNGIAQGLFIADIYPAYQWSIKDKRF